ncbi:Ig-like domain-containing protein [Qipengyuania seohaensis]|uniref:Ig-like domain-containing protein n=1 Tax=Qipengyuania seohaensis TaxID=266951 RepID=UPI001E46ED4C|nr:Ig-like domain-containing protein [Qipengyuania seohaensis]
MMDSFEQNGEFADAQDSQDMDTGNSQSSAAATRANADIILVPNEDGVVILPDGASLENLTSAGRDLVIVLDDGTRILIPEGAIIVPQIVVDGVTVPAANLAALLTGNEPQPAAGDPQSSGGNFEVDPGNIQAAYDIGDLLPYTQLQFPEPEEREIIPYLVDQDPEIVVETPDNPAGVINAIATVDESGLPARTIDGTDESEGTQDETNLETSTGTIVFNSPDGVASVAINGVAITEVGQTFVGDKGILTITSIDIEGGEIGFSFTLTDNLVGETVDGSFSMTVTDTDGDSATATLQINVVDDAPIARDDSNDVPGGSHDTIFGNVTDNDESGADSYPDTGAVTGFANSGGSAEPGNTLVGTYGELTLNADGSYSYDRFVNTPGGVSEEFTYTITDTDGSTSTATLTINIGDAPNVITNVPDGEDATVVEEGQLPPTTDTRDDEPEGSNFDGDDETATGTITFTSPDGVDTVTIGGTVIDPNNLPQVVVSDDTGTLTVTGYTYDPETGVGTITYDYELTDNTGDTDGTTVTFPIVITDLDGDQAEDDLDITIVDDVPEAVDDTASQAGENASISIDVLANDTVGADGVDLATGVEAVDGSLSGTGSLAYNDDGSFTYTPGAGETGTVTFQYTITDGDGDVSTATVTLTLSPDSTPEISVEGDNDVDEAALGARDGEPAGSNSASDGEIATGVISITTGGDTVASLVINGVNVTGGGQVATDSGVLTITESNGAYSYSFELLDNTLSDPDSETFSLTVTDSDGDTASTTLVIAIIDDAPSAEDDSNAIAAGEYGPVGGNVLANDTVGADDASVTSFTGSGGSGAAGETVQGAYGTLTIGADGTYSYTRDPGTPGDVEDSFDYVITDGDGDTATATLVISIADSPVTLDLPVAGEAGTEVDEAGLPAGSAAATDGEFTSGTFTYTAPDGPAVITIGGTAVTAVGQTFTGSFGTLTVTSIADGAIGYTYELTTNTDGDDTFDSFEVTVTDQDGDTVAGDLDIDIIDDVPTARPDSDSVTEDGPLSASGNVISDAEANGDDGEDTQGADGAEVSAFSFGTDPGTLGEPLAGMYGTLTLDADGEYIYELDNTNPLVQGLDSNDILTEVFKYTLTDGDGDARSTTLTITINGADDIVTINGLDLQTPEEVVDEDDLPEGSSPDANALVQDGSFTVDSPDGLSVLTVGGTAVWGNGETYPVSITGDFGTARITDVTVTTDANGDVVSATVSYEYELSDNTLEHDAAGEDDVTDSFEVVATDTDGSQDSASLDIQVIDDVPTAEDDTNSVVEGLGNFTTGNVYDGAGLGDNPDELGADTDGTAGVEVTGVRTGEEGDAGALTTVGTQVTISGTYGDLTIEDDGSYTYTLTTALIPPSVTSETFTYQITDADGDTDLAELVITLNQDPNAPDITGDALTVYEDGLADGVQYGADSETAAGSFDVSTNGEDVTFTLTADNGNTLTDPAIGDTLTTTKGVIEITSITDDGNGTFTYGYEYTLSAPLTHTGQGEGTPILDTVTMSVTDATGDSDATPGSIVISIVDDVPVAEDNTNTVSEGASTAGNILTDDDGFGVDVAGADGLAGILGVTSDDSGDSDATGPFTVTSSLGTLTVQANGDYTYDSFANSTNANTTDTFTYQIIDADGDISEAQLVITINNVAGNVSDNDALVFEAGLDGIGSDAGSDSEIDANGQITVTGASGTLTYSLTSSATGSYGTLTLDPVTGEYTYTLTTPVDGDTLSPDQGGDNDDNTINATVVTGFETFTYQVVDQDNNVIGTGEIQVSIVDDVPTATDQTLITVAEDAADIGGNVMTDGVADTEGADGATVTSITVGADTVAVPQDGSDATLSNANGTYTIDMDGNWTFNPTDSLDQTGGPIVADFTYTLTDGDGDLDTATQPIRIEDGQAPGNPDGLDLALDDQNLADGSTPGGDDFDQGTINFVPGSDPFATIVFGDVLDLGGDLDWVRTGDFEIVGSDGNGPVVTLTLVVNGNDATVTATLNDNYLGHDLAGDDLDDLGFVNVVATDTDGDKAFGRVDVSVSDDVPTAEDDTNSVVEGLGNFTTGNVYDGAGVGDNPDELGADTDGTAGVEVTGVRTGEEGDAGALTVVGGAVTVSGTYGDLTINPDGSYTYTLTTASIPPSVTSETFTYQITDADGDTDLAELVITLNQDPNAPDITGDALTVYEDGLADGVQYGADSETAAGSFDVSTNGEDVTFTLTADNGNTLTDPAIGETLTTTKGVIEITNIVDNGGGNFTYEYTYTLSAPLTHTGQGEGAPILDTVTMSVTDATGDSDATPGSIVISIVDDVPVAEDDTNSVVEGLGNFTTGNVYDGAGVGDNPDELGADTDGTAGVEVTGVRTGEEGDAGALTAVGGAVTVSSAYGDLTINPDGSYTYTLTTASIPSGVTSDTFTYQITDADGDTDLAELVITLNQDPNAPDITGDALTVFEDGLAAGSQYGADSETAAGSFDVVTNGEDVTFTLTADNGNTLTDPAIGDTLTTTKGVIEITSITDDGNGTFTYGYEYTLSAPLTHTGQGEGTPILDTVTMSVTDATGDSDATPGSIVISIVDDVPVAIDPVDILTGFTNSPQSATRDLDLDGEVVNNIGADQPGDIVFNHSNGDDSGVDYQGTDVLIYVSSDGTTIEGRAGAAADGTGGTLVFTVDLNQGDANYTFTLLEPVDNGSGTKFSDLSGGQAGNPPFKIIDSAETGSIELLFTPINAGSVNSDTDDVGVDGQFINIQNPDAGLNIHFGQFTPVDLSGGPAPEAYTMDSLSNVNGFRFTLDQISNGTTADIRLTAYDADTDGGANQTEPTYDGGDSIDEITRVDVYDASGNLVGSFDRADGDVTNFNGTGLDIVWETNTALVQDVNAQFSIVAFTDDGYNNILITNAGSGTDGKFSLSDLRITETEEGNQVSTSFDLKVIDEDLDEVVISDAIQVNIDPVGSASATTTTSSARTMETTMIAAAASAFMMGDTGGTDAFSPDSPGDGSTTTYSFMEMDGSLKLSGVESGFTQEFVQEADFDLASAQMAPYEANILEGGFAIGDSTPAFGFDAPEMGIDYAAFDAPEVGAFASNDAFDGLDMAAGGAAASMEALLLMEAPLPEGAIAELDAKAAIGEAISDLTAEAGVDALVSHFAGGNGAANDGWHSIAPTESLLDTMVQPGLAQSLANGLTVDQLDDAALAGTAA